MAYTPVVEHTLTSTEELFDAVLSRNRIEHRLGRIPMIEIEQPASAALSARWYSITRAWCSPNHIPMHAARN